MNDGGDFERSEALEEWKRVYFCDWVVRWDRVVVTAVFYVVGLN